MSVITDTLLASISSSVTCHRYFITGAEFRTTACNIMAEMLSCLQAFTMGGKVAGITLFIDRTRVSWITVDRDPDNVLFLMPVTRVRENRSCVTAVECGHPVAPTSWRLTNRFLDTPYPVLWRRTCFFRHATVVAVPMAGTRTQLFSVPQFSSGYRRFGLTCWYVRWTKWEYTQWSVKIKIKIRIVSSVYGWEPSDGGLRWT